MKIKTANIKIEREIVHFNPDDSRVVTRFFTPGNSKKRIEGIIERILSLPEKEIKHILAQTIENFSDRHLDIKRIFKDNFDRINTNDDYSFLSLDKKLLIGSYFTKEYSIESAALFNPSIVAHPDQSILKKGKLRVIISFRAVGEGHISSIVFRKGIINENLYIMFSDNIYYWKKPKLLKTPTFYWEFFQIGNCGSPIKTKDGWLLLTHGVGPVRTYCIGAVLLSLDDPSKVIGAIKDPILVPGEKERNGYVPNVAYSCGAIIHNDKLILPFAMSDSYSGVAKIDIYDILDEMSPIKN